MISDKAKAAILDKCCQKVDCLARGEVIDLEGAPDLHQSASPVSETATGFPDAETELAFLEYLGSAWSLWQHHVGSTKWHDLRKAFIAGRGGLAQTPAALIPTPEQIEPILDDYLAVDCPHYEEMRRRCAQRIFDLCVVMSGAPIQSNNQIAVSDTSTDRTCK
jgi:hypothetical protein